jgi:mono/diheme cytochrome c family protein
VSWWGARSARIAASAAAVGVAAVAISVAIYHRSRPVAERTAEQWNLLQSYCVDCHNSAELTAGIAFDAMAPGDVPNEAEIFEHVVRKLRGGLMPPPGNPRPDAGRVAAFVSALEDYLDESAAASPKSGRVGLQRLNRREYANAVRDLLGVEIDPAAFLPQDDTSAGFDNNAATLSSSPLFVSQFVDAARLVANLAVGVDSAALGSDVYSSSSGRSRSTRTGRPYEAEELPLGARDGFVVTHAFPVGGEYAVSIDDMVRTISTVGVQYPNRIVVTVDGEIVYETSIGGDDDLRTIDQRQTAGVDAINSRLKDIRFTVEAGQREVAVLFARRTHAESEDLIEAFADGVGADTRMEVLRLRGFEIRGPFEIAAAPATASRQRVFTCYPETARDEDACAEEIVGALATRAYRRRLSESELAERLAFYHAAKKDGFESGIHMAIVGILASPHFLFRTDEGPSDIGPSDIGTAAASAVEPVYPLTDVELASKLAFFLWSSVPDDELLGLAQAGRLSSPSVLAEQVRRMLADSRAETLAADFAYQWLHLNRLDAIRPDVGIFPNTQGRLDPRPDYLREIGLFVDSIFREDRSVLDLLQARHTFVNETLAWRYGIEGVRGNQFRRVELEDSARWGLLGKGALLLASSYPNRTSPVLRGEYVMRNIIGVPPAPPPPEVETDLDSVAAEEILTVRERLAIHRDNPSCNGCHGIMDPLGFALENFDADGTWRDVDRESGRAIDASGLLPDGSEIAGPDALREALLARPEQFVQTFVEKLLAYALGRSTEWYDMPAVRRVVRDSADQDYRFSALVMGIVQSAPFATRDVDAGGTSELSARLQTGPAAERGSLSGDD